MTFILKFIVFICVLFIFKFIWAKIKKKPVKKREIIIPVLGTLILSILIIGSTSEDPTKSSSSENIMTASQITEFKKQCTEESFEELARKPDSHMNEKLVLTGKVIQVVDDSNNETFRINITYNGETESYNDTVLVTYKMQNGEEKILEDDIVHVYGTSQGLKTYDSAMNTKITVPYISAVSIDRVNKNPNK